MSTPPSVTARFVRRRQKGTDVSWRSVSSTTPGMSAGSATTAAQRSGASSSRRIMLPMR
jgi:hypothetical protein